MNVLFAGSIVPPINQIDFRFWMDRAGASVDCFAIASRMLMSATSTKFLWCFYRHYHWPGPQLEPTWKSFPMAKNFLF